MVNKCFPHMIQDECVQTRKCTPDDKTQRQTGPESNDLGGQWANDACTSKLHVHRYTCTYAQDSPTESPPQSRNKNTQKYLQPSTFMQMNVFKNLWLTQSYTFIWQVKKTWLVFGNDVQFHFPNFPEVLLCCHYRHPKLQMSPRPSQNSTDSFCSPG